jgi:DNA-binding XRE family transcriptional regulator
MKTHHTKNSVLLTDGTKQYLIPKNVANDYIVDPDDSIPAEVVFADLNRKYTKAGALLKGVRVREGLNQEEFAKVIGVEQANLSKMENGKRAIGRTVAQRIAKAFDLNYKIFLE